MKKKEQDWRDYNLEDDEIELLESVENREWKSIGNIEERRNNLRSYFSDDEDTNFVNIPLKKSEFDLIVHKSKHYGMNYKEVLEKLVQNFANGKITL